MRKLMQSFLAGTFLFIPQPPSLDEYILAPTFNESVVGKNWEKTEHSNGKNLDTKKSLNSLETAVEIPEPIVETKEDILKEILLNPVNEEGVLEDIANQYSIEILKTLRKFSYQRGKIFLNHVDEWAYLIENDVEIEKMNEIPNWDLENIVDGFRNERWSFDLIRKISTRNELIKYSRSVAESDRHFDRGVEWAKKYVVKKLKNKKHAKRPKTDYTEGYETVEVMQGRHQIFLLKQYIDFFESEKAKKIIPKLFIEKDSHGSPEQGGIFFSGDGVYDFMAVPNDIKEKGGDEMSSYSTPAIQRYIPNIGLLHTHPLQKGADRERYAGPSGWSKQYFPISRTNPVVLKNDTSVLYTIANKNPYEMEIVVTQLGDDKYNIDAYFRDTVEKWGTLFAAGNVSVVDIGVYEYPSGVTKNFSGE